MGLGWQEFAIIGVSLVMCLASFLPLVIIFLILKRRFQSQSPSPPQAEHHARTTPTPTQTPPDDENDEWGQTKYGFDDTDWGSEWDDDRDDTPRIQR